MIAQPALPARTASSASSKLKHGNGRHCGHASIAARCELAPGEPWKAIARSGAAAADSRKIGSASCRERVCQYVSISVVAVPFKKKKQNTKPTSKKPPTDTYLSKILT